MGFILDRFDTLLPLAAKWACEQQQRILRDGVPLSEEEIADAKAVGVQQPDHVRLLPVEAIPFPPHPLLRLARTALNFLSFAPRGLALEHGIFVRADCWRDRALIVHELVHTAQYERLGGIVPFLRKYLRECATIGYSKGPMEQEAIATTARICSSG
jgi:hypothetical protein